MVVGTQALTAKGVSFHNLSLVVVDEEQRLGVDQKVGSLYHVMSWILTPAVHLQERLKAMASGMDVLTLSATPIPRTLQLGLSGIRDMSLITTTPLDRKPVRTRAMNFSEDTVREAILTEVQRGGQVVNDAWPL